MDYNHDIQSLCAICIGILQTENVKALNTSIEPNASLKAYQLLESITNFKFHTNGPHFACADCFYKLSGIFIFQQMCNDAQVFFDKYLKQQTYDKNINNTNDYEGINSRNNCRNTIPVNIKQEVLVEDTTEQNFSSSEVEFNNQHSNSGVNDNCGIKIKEEQEEYIGDGIEEYNHTDHDDIKYEMVVDDTIIHNLKVKNEISYEGYETVQNITNVDEEELRGSWGDTSQGYNSPNQFPLQCRICYKGYATTKLLEIHMCTHTGEKPYVCSQCNARFTQKGNLKRHELKHAERPYKCDICVKGFEDSAQLEMHLQHNHTGAKPFKCSHCSACFAQKCNMKRHELTHLRKPFQCGFCDRNFADNVQLDIHVQQTHTGEKPFKCNHCDARFKQKGNLKRHEFTHIERRPHQCNICQKSFGDLTSLKIHLRIHTGEKPFTCTTCDVRFTQKCHLKAHERIHFVECIDLI